MDTDKDVKPKVEHLHDDALDIVVGGVVVSPPYEKTANSKCWYERDTTQNARLDINGFHVWWKCKAKCWVPFDYCICHGTDTCVDNWHVFAANGAHMR